MMWAGVPRERELAFAFGCRHFVSSRVVACTAVRCMGRRSEEEVDAQLKALTPFLPWTIRQRPPGGVRRRGRQLGLV